MSGLLGGGGGAILAFSLSLRMGCSSGKALCDKLTATV